MSDDTAPRVTYTADMVVCAPDETGRPHVLLIQRGWPPHLGSWALPGGWVDPGETALAAAVRELAEEAGVTVDPADVRPVGVFDDPHRDSRGRYVSAAYAVYLPDMPEPTAGDDAADARWWPLEELPELAFDHAQILRDSDVVLEQCAMPTSSAVDRAWSLLTGLVQTEGDHDGHLAAAADHLRKYSNRGGGMRTLCDRRREPASDRDGGRRVPPGVVVVGVALSWLALVALILLALAVMFLLAGCDLGGLPVAPAQTVPVPVPVPAVP